MEAFKGAKVKKTTNQPKKNLHFQSIFKVIIILAIKNKQTKKTHVACFEFRRGNQELKGLCIASTVPRKMIPTCVVAEVFLEENSSFNASVLILVAKSWMIFH